MLSVRFEVFISWCMVSLLLNMNARAIPRPNTITQSTTTKHTILLRFSGEETASKEESVEEA